MRALFCLLLVGLNFGLSAQTQTIQIQLTQKGNIPIPFAYLSYKDSIQLTANENGKASFEIKKDGFDKDCANGLAILKISHVAFRDTVIKFLPGKYQPTQRLNIQLKSIELRTVDIVAKQKKTDGIQSINSKTIEFIPTASGDFINAALSTQLGVSSTNELSASYSVRGGSYDENLVYVNGIEVYRPFLVRAGQQEGLSFINGNMVESIDFSAGGFSAKYGDKLSSVLDVKYKQPQRNGGGFEIGLLGSEIFLENVLAKGKISHVSAIRFRKNRSVLNGLDTKGEYNPTFYDGQTFWTFNINNKSSLNVLGQFSSNTYNFTPTTRETEFGGIQQALRFTVFFDGQEESKFASGTGAIQYNYYPNPRLKLTQSLSYFQTREQESFDVVGQYFLDELDRNSGSETFGDVLQNLGVGGFLNHARNEINANVLGASSKMSYKYSKNTFSAGLEYKKEHIEDRINEWVYIDSADFGIPQNPGGDFILSDRLNAKNTIDADRISAYANNEFVFENKREEQWKLNTGIRFQHYSFTNSSFVSPRASVSFLPMWYREINDSTTVKKQLSFRFAVGSYNQNPFYREMRTLDASINSELRAQKSIHFVLGSDYELLIWGRPFILSTELYYKQLKDLVPYELENVRLRYYGDNLSDGYARGIDLKLNGEFVKGIESWITMSYQKTEEDLYDDEGVMFVDADGVQTFPSASRPIADTVTFSPGSIPRPTDQRFVFGMYFADYMPSNPEYKVYLSLIFGTPLPYGPPSFERYKDVLRSVAYRRVDIGFSRDLITAEKHPKWLKPFNSAYISLDVFNLIQINNVVNYQWVTDVSGRQYSVPNYLTGRRVNLKFAAKF
mgnify:FL=1